MKTATAAVLRRLQLVVIVSVESARDRSLLEQVNNVSMVSQKLIKYLALLFLQGPLTPTNYDSLVSMATTEITNQLEASVMKASFNRVSCQINFVSHIPHNYLCSNNLLNTSPSD